MNNYKKYILSLFLLLFGLLNSAYAAIVVDNIQLLVEDRGFGERIYLAAGVHSTINEFAPILVDINPYPNQAVLDSNNEIFVSLSFSEGIIGAPGNGQTWNYSEWWDLPLLSDNTYAIVGTLFENDNLNQPWLGNKVELDATQIQYIVQTVPIPSAVLLFGSGLIGLVGFARHKKA